MMEFIELKTAEKVGKVLSYAVIEKKYNRYELIKSWLLSETFQSIIDFEASICTQSALYIFHAFEREMKSCCPQYDEDGDLYEDDLF